VAGVVSGALLGCHAPPRADPQAVYASIRGDFLHGSLDVAHTRVELALKGVSGAGPPDKDWALKFRLLDAEILTYQGRPREVLALLTANDIAKPSDGESAIEWNLLCGLAHASVRDDDKADQEISAARRLAEATGSPRIGAVLRTEAEITDQRGSPAPAMLLYKQSLRIAREQHDSNLEAEDLLDLGYAALELKHYDEALGEFSDAATVARSVGAGPVSESALGNAGWAYYDLGDFEHALSNFQQAERAARQIGTSSAQIRWLQSEGLAYFKLGDLNQAQANEEKALSAAYSLKRPGDIVDIETSLGFLSLRQGRDVLARRHSEAAAKSLQPSMDESIRLPIALLQALLEARHSSVAATATLLRLHADAGDDPALRWEIENALAHAYADGQDAGQAERWYRRSIDTFEAQRSAVNNEALKLSFFGNGATLYRDYADFLIATRRSDQALRLLDQGRARTLEEGLQVSSQGRAVDPGSVARHLDATILFYSLGPEKSYLWAVTPKGAQLYALPAQNTIEAWLRDYRKTILRSGDPLREPTTAAQALYDTLVAPAAAMLAHGAKVVVVPDGMLYELDFDTLVRRGADGLHYWIEDVSVSTVSSIRLQATAVGRASDARAEDLLLIGDPETKGTDFEELPNAGAEVGRIEHYFPAQRQTVFTGARAAPAAYAQSDPGRFAYIHFVAHGTASRTSPLDSAVILSPPPDDPTQFKLYARDIVTHPLRARLVTVSACYGSGVRAYAGEGLVGLSWAFLRAGAHNVISALWEADDAATLQLMDRMYRELSQGAAPDAALRAAKLSLIHSDGAYRKPLYWGAFQLYAGA